MTTKTKRRLRAVSYLKDIGFVFEKFERNAMMIECKDVLNWQQKHLLHIAEHKHQHLNVVYNDQTWVNARLTVMKALGTRQWRDETSHRTLSSAF